MSGELKVLVLRWNGVVEVIRVVAGVQRTFEIPSGGFFSMTVCAGGTEASPGT